MYPKITINLADEQLFLAYAKDPGRLKNELAALGGSGLIFVDEVQRLPSLLNTIQSLIDDPRGLLSLSETAGRYKPVKKWVIYRGETELVLDNEVHVYPYLNALVALRGDHGS